MPVKELSVMLKTLQFRINHSTLYIFDISDVVLELKDVVWTFLLQSNVNTFQKQNYSISYSLS